MRRISASTWAEIRTAYASGIGLREIARNMEYRPGQCSHDRNAKDGPSR